MIGVLGLASAAASAFAAYMFVFLLPIIRSHFALCPPIGDELHLRVLAVGANQTNAHLVRVPTDFWPWRPAVHEEPLLSSLRLLKNGVAPGTAFTEHGTKLSCLAELVNSNAGKQPLVYLGAEGVPWQWAPEAIGYVRQVRVRWQYGDAEDQARFVLESAPGTHEVAWELAARRDAVLATKGVATTASAADDVSASSSEGQDDLVTLETLSASPPVFRVRGLLPDTVAHALLDHATPELSPSTVGDGSSDSTGNRVRDDRRSSSSAWLHGFNDPRKTLPAVRAVQRAAAVLLRLSPPARLTRSVEPLLCVRYRHGEFYEPHHDFFAGGGSSTEANDPAYRPPNGTNRFATLIFYLAEPEAGGHTVFPFAARPHVGAEEKTLTDVAYAGDLDAPSCDFPNLKQRRGLLVRPRKGDALLFYSQTPDGSLDGRTRHGACPVHGSKAKAAANLWLWNRDARYV